MVDSLAAFFEARERQVYFVLLAVLVAGAWCPVLNTGLTLDETGTVWTIAGGSAELVPRAVHFPQSILYAAFVLAWSKVCGLSEVALRLPSLLAAVSAAYLLFVLGRRLLGAAAGLMAALMWAALPVVTDLATSARPYIFCALFVLASYWALLRWMDRVTPSRWILYVFLAAIPTYFSYFSCVVFLSQMVYVWTPFKMSRRVIPRWQTLSTPISVALLQLPLLGPTLAAMSTRASHTYLGTPGPSALIYELIPNALAYGLVCALTLYSTLQARGRFVQSDARSDHRLLLVTWASIPMVTLFLLSVFTPTKVFTARYAIGASPALALLFARLVRGFEPALLRVLAVGLTAVFAVMGLGPPKDFWHQKRYCGYRSASQYLATTRNQSDLPIVALSGFVEAAHLSFPVSDYDKNCLLAPLISYPVGGEVTLLPSALHGGTRDYVESFWEEPKFQRGFLLYAGNPNDLPQWLIEQAGSKFRQEVLHNEDDASIIRFLRR